MTLATRLGYLFAVAAIAASLTACGSSQPTAPITGKYTTTIFKPLSAQGTYTLDFKKNGTGTVAVNGQPTPHTFTFKGSTLTIPGGGENVCPTAGTYRIHLAGKHLKFTVIHEPCTIGRALIFPGRIWTRVGNA